MVCPKLLHIPAALGAWQRAGFPCKLMTLLCSLGQGCSKETLLTMLCGQHQHQPQRWALGLWGSALSKPWEIFWRHQFKWQLCPWASERGWWVKRSPPAFPMQHRIPGCVVHSAPALCDPAPWQCCITQAKTSHFVRWLKWKEWRLPALQR